MGSVDLQVKNSEKTPDFLKHLVLVVQTRFPFPYFILPSVSVQGFSFSMQMRGATLIWPSVLRYYSNNVNYKVLKTQCCYPSVPLIITENQHTGKQERKAELTARTKKKKICVLFVDEEEFGERVRKKHWKDKKRKVQHSSREGMSSISVHATGSHIMYCGEKSCSWFVLLIFKIESKTRECNTKNIYHML